MRTEKKLLQLTGEMNPGNDHHQLNVLGPREQTPSNSLTLPPIELEKSVSKKKSKKRKRLRKRLLILKKFSPEEDNSGNLLAQKSQSSRSSNDKSRVSFDSPITGDVRQDRISAVKPILIPFVILHGSAYGVTVPFMWYHQHCSSEEGSLTIFDNVVAYAISVVGLGCVVFFEEVQNTPPYNIICPLIASNALAYLLAKVACNRELILILEMASIAGIEMLAIFLISIFSSKDLTPVTPLIIAAYFGTSILHLSIIYFAGDTVPIIMLNVINLFLAFGLCLCIMQFPITSDPRYRLPHKKRIFGAIMLHYATLSLSTHTYMTTAAIFNVYDTKRFEHYVVNLTFYLEQ